jgi:hypothetical protein
LGNEAGAVLILLEANPKLRLQREVWAMKKVFVPFLLLALWLVLDRSGVWAVDLGWMQPGVRVWYFGAASTGFSSDAEEAYLFNAVNGNNATLTHHSGINHWSLPTAVTETGSIVDQGPFWIHPQVLQNIAIDDNWQGHRITNVLRVLYTYGTFIQEISPSGSIPYLLLPIKALFDLTPQRNLVKIVYQIDFTSTGIAYFDTETGLLLLRENSTGFVTVFFILSEINYDFANHTAFAEDNGPHTGFRSNVIKTKSELYATHMLNIFSSVESRYGNTVQMWTSTQAGGASGFYLPVVENYCFFGNVPVLRRKLMSATPQYPPENWNEYGDYLWWWLPAGALADASIDIFGVSMTRTSTAPYTFTAAGTRTGLYFPAIIFDNDGYMTDFAAKDPSIGLDIGLGASAAPFTPAAPNVPIHLVEGLAYYKETMGRATPPGHILTLTVVSDTLGKGGGLVFGAGNINCNGHGSSPSGMSGTCQAEFPAGAVVSLTQDPDADSTWATWSAAGCGMNQNCQVLMNGAKNLTVTFHYSPMAKVNSTGYRFDSIALAYGNAASTDTIYSRAVTFQENFNLGSGKAITLLGGRDAWYNPLNADTVLQGILSITNGSLTVENLAIR